MANIENINNIEHLRDVAIVQQGELQRLIARNHELAVENARLRGQVAPALQDELTGLKELLALREKELFGRSSEKRRRAPEENSPGDEPQRGHGRTEQPSLPLVNETHELPANDRTCVACGDELSEMPGQFEDSEEVTVVERSFRIVRHRRKKYRCACNGHVATAPAPQKLTPGGRYSLDFAIEVAVSKYLDHHPLERQVRIMEREGLVVTSQALWDQIERLAAILKPTHTAIRNLVLGSPVVGADETWWRLMSAEEHVKRWWVWALESRTGIYFEIANTRGQKAASVLLAGYDGTVMADGYGVYGALSRDGKGFTLANCWSHVRRKFVDIEENFPVECRAVLDLIGEIYAVEHEARDAAGDYERLLDLRRRLRNERSGAIIRRIEQWVFEQRALPQSGLGKSIAYMKGLWTGLTVFLGDPHVPLDNNATERALRGPVIGRKNYYGARSKRGTEVAALFYSLLETAKIRGEEPKAYLRRAALAALAVPGTVTLPLTEAAEAAG